MSIFASLAGAWALTRTFSPGIGSMTGTATFTPVAEDELAYREDGRLVLATGYSGDAWREYRYVRDGATTIRVVLPDTGVTMHTLDLAGGGATSDLHLCGADTYLGRYRFEPPDRFVVDMEVDGPRKDYATHTVYERRTGWWLDTRRSPARVTCRWPIVRGGERHILDPPGSPPGSS